MNLMIRFITGNLFKYIKKMAVGFPGEEGLITDYRSVA